MDAALRVIVTAVSEQPGGFRDISVAVSAECMSDDEADAWVDAVGRRFALVPVDTEGEDG